MLCRHEGLLAGLEPVEDAQGHRRLFVGKAPGQGHRSIDDNAGHGRASWRKSRIVIPRSESPWVFPKLLSCSIASTTSFAGGDGLGLPGAVGRWAASSSRLAAYASIPMPCAAAWRASSA